MESRVPQPVVVVTQGARASVTDVQRCTRCAQYEEPRAARCGDDGSGQAEVVLPAGRTKVLFSRPDTGEGSLRGTWEPQAGGVYSVCLWQSDEPALHADGR